MFAQFKVRFRVALGKGFTLRSLGFFKVKRVRPLLNLILASLVALLAAGCGSSSNDFVYNGGGQTGTGSLLFHFERPVTAQTTLLPSDLAAQVPADTVKLGFKFFGADDSVVLEIPPLDYADQIQVDNVPNTAVHVQITAFGAGDQALGYCSAPITVSSGLVVDVDLSQATFTPVTTNGQLIVEPESITLSSASLLTGGEAAFLNLATLKAYYVAPGATTRQDVTLKCGIAFSNFSPSTVTADSFFATKYGPILLLGANGGGIGALIYGGGTGAIAPEGATGLVTVTYIKDGQTLTDTVNFTVGQPTLTGITVESGVNGALTLPQNTNAFPVLALAHYSNGLSFPLVMVDSSVDPFGNTFSMAVADTSKGVTTDGSYSLNVSSSATVGPNTTVNFFVNGSTTPEASLNINVTAATVDDVILAPASIDVDPTGSYAVTLHYTDGTTQDVSSLWQNLETSDDDMVTFGGPFSLVFGYGGAQVFGRQIGTTTMDLGEDVDGFLNGTLGLPGTNGNTTNDQATLNVLSVLSIGSMSFPLP